MAGLRHFVNVLDHDGTFLAGLIAKAVADKARRREGTLPASMQGKVLAVYSEKPSLRTRVSFEVAALQLGGHSLYLTQAEVGLGHREPIKDVARVLSGMCDGIVTRTFSHEAVVDLAAQASVPVINALTDFSHPCQAMADVMTIRETLGRLDGVKLAYVGDGNNVARSLAGACARLGMGFAIAAPRAYQLEEAFVNSLLQAEPGTVFWQGDDVREAVSGADVVYTDTWVSMGQETGRDERLKAFEGYQVNDALLAGAKESAIVMHCLPAYRGYEITDEVIEGRRSVVFDQAENRLHFQRALLAVLIGGETV